MFSNVGGSLVTIMAFGIPGDAVTAVMLGALTIHGIQPGPMLMIAHPHFVYEVVAMTSLATVTILIFGLFLVKPLLVILKIRRTVLMPIIFLVARRSGLSLIKVGIPALAGLSVMHGLVPPHPGPLVAMATPTSPVTRA